MKNYQQIIQNCNKHLPLYGKTESFRPRPEWFFNTGCLNLFIPMQWNYFQTKQVFTKLWKNVSKIDHFTDKPIVVVATFSVILIWSSSDWNDISTQADLFYLSIPMQWNHFQTEQLSIRLWKNVSNIYYYQPEIDLRHGNFSAWY